MRLSPFVRKWVLVLCCASFDLFFVSERHCDAAPLRECLSLLQSQTSPKARSSGQTTAQKLANPLNDLLDEAQRDIDQNQFEAAITPLQKVLADQPDFAYGHF